MQGSPLEDKLVSEVMPLMFDIKQGINGMYASGGGDFPKYVCIHLLSVVMFCFVLCCLYINFTLFLQHIIFTSKTR